MSIGEDRKTKEPLYRHIQHQLRGRIARGEWNEGQALPNRRALCSEFGTTRVTLDKAISGLVRDGWLHSAAGSGTFVSAPAPAAPRLTGRPQRTATTSLQQVGIVLGRQTPPETPDGGDDTDHRLIIEDFYFGPLFQGLRDEFSGKSVNVTYAHVEDGDYLGYFQQSHLDGMVVLAPSLADLATLRQMAAATVPFVAVAISSSTSEADQALPCMDTDNRYAAFCAVEHLLALGHRQIALVNLALSHANHHDRMEGYQRALATAAVAVDPDHLVLAPLYEGANFEAHVDDWLTRMRELDKVPTAIFASDYSMTLATLQVLRRHGLRVPQDVSVVGFDNPLSAAHLTPPLTTVHQPSYQMGRRAARRLLDHLQGDCASPLAGTETLPNALIIRESTCPPLKHHPERTVTS